MDSSNEDSGAAVPPVKKTGPFDNLSREDLIKKCKGLLAIAQKAKSARDESVEENKKLKDELANSETQKSADKDCLKTMQEIVESLTQNKLNSTTKIDNLERTIAVLEEKLKSVQDYDNCMIENESLKRQLKRISDENEEVMRDMTTLEKNNNELEKNMKNLCQKNEKLLADFVSLEQQIMEMKEPETNTQERDDLLSRNEVLSGELSSLEQKNRDLEEQLKAMSSLNETQQHNLSELQKQLDKFQSDSDKHKTLEAEKEKLQTELQNIQTANEKFKSESADEKKSFLVEISALQRDLVDIRRKHEGDSHEKELKMENEKLLADLANLKTDYDKLSADLLDSKETVAKLQSEKQEVDGLSQLQQNEDVEKIRKKMNLYKTKLFEIASKLRQLKSNREVLLETIRDYAVAIPTWQSEIANASKMICTNLLRLEKENLQLLEQAAENTKNLAQSKAENSELLAELKEINNVIKERGEVISLQLSKINELQQCLNAKEKQLSDLSEELASTRERDMHCETLSTSTISRADESLRMREIDDSFEEKYNKLRSLAVKLKKKVTEQQTQLQKYETDDNKLSSKNIKTLQQENDKLQDELDALKQTNSVNERNITELNTKIEELDTNQNKLETVKAGKLGADQAIREYQTQITNLKKDKEACNQSIKNLENENQQLKNSLKAKEKELTEEMSLQKQTRAEIDKLKQAVKKTNVLSLEMEAYEKSLTDINKKLEIKRTQCVELEQTIGALNDTVSSLKNQIKLLDSELAAEKQHSKEVKSQIDLQQNKLRESEHINSELVQQLENMKRDYETMKIDVNDAKFELGNSINEREKICGILEIEKTKLTKRVYELEDSEKTLTNALNEKEKQIDDLNTEFASYKVRAQSVLRQNQTKDTNREKELEEEISMLHSQATARENKISVITHQYEERETVLTELKSDKQRLQNRCKELLDLLDELRIQNETSIEEHRKLNVEYTESLKSQKLQNETLSNCYKKQIDDIEEKYCKEIDNLNMKLKFFSMHKPDEVSAGHDRPNMSASDEQKINLILMEREEGEGSESATSQSSQVFSHQHQTMRRKLSNSNKVRRELIPLDELLNNSFDESSTIMSENIRAISPTLELQHTKEKLNTQENRAKHLTALLAETEQDLVKLTQLNEVLKEEVRRQQRSIEREQHVHNSEYLKNIVFKFLTLKEGDEKSHLVPVLNTILKLSPEETQTLQSVAKGDTGGGGRGWSLWSSN